jgi:hypothetical protein
MTSDTLTPNLKAFPDHVDQAIARTIDYFSVQTEAYMRSHAPWNDVTGNARNGLRARPEHDGHSHSILCYHTVPYGIWLEVRWEGKYAIIAPTIKTQGRALMAFMRGLMKKVPR